MFNTVNVDLTKYEILIESQRVLGRKIFDTIKPLTSKTLYQMLHIPRRTKITCQIYCTLEQPRKTRYDETWPLDVSICSMLPGTVSHNHVLTSL